MQKLDVLSDGPFRYIHSTETGAAQSSGRLRRTL